MERQKTVCERLKRDDTMPGWVMLDGAVRMALFFVAACGICYLAGRGFEPTKIQSFAELRSEASQALEAVREAPTWAWVSLGVVAVVHLLVTPYGAAEMLAEMERDGRHFEAKVHEEVRELERRLLIKSDDLTETTGRLDELRDVVRGLRVTDDDGPTFGWDRFGRN